MIQFDKALFNDFLKGQKSISEVTIGDICIGEQFSVIPKEEIIDIYVADKNIEGYNFSNSDFTITERLLKLENNDGFIHLAGGLNCRIENKIIVDLRLSKRYVEPFNSLTKVQIIAYNGLPTIELIDDMAFGGFDYAIENIILVYESKNVSFYFDPNELTLKEINTNKLNLEHYRINK